MKDDLAMRVAAMLRRPFWLLVRHFLRRMFATAGAQGSGGLDLSLGAVLGILALPGGFISLLLMQKYSPLLHWFKGKPYFDPYAASLPDKYFFVVLSMVVTGMITVVRWNRIFPDRADYMTFAPMPLPLSKIFAANFTAILLVAVTFAIDVNAASSILFPMVVTKESAYFTSFLRFAFTHAVIMFVASIFTFFSLLGLLGVLMALVPQRLFARISLFVRIGTMMALLAVLCTCFAVPPLLRDVGAHRFIAWLPPVWFAGAYQAWQGRATPELAALGRFGMRMVPLVIAAAFASYLLAYRRYFLKIPEHNPLATMPSGSARIPLGWLAHLIARSPVERSCYLFAIRTLIRSEEHCLLTGGFIAFGFVLAAQTATGATSIMHALGAPFLLYFFVMIGLRVAFNIPVEYKANWIFQVAADDSSDRAARVASKVLLTPVIPLVLMSTCVMAWLRGWPMAAIHLAFSLFWCVLFAEILVVSYRKIFFTCSMPPMTNRGPMMFVLAFLGLLSFTGIGTDWEYALLVKPSRLIWLVIFAVIAFRLLKRFRREVLDVEPRVLYEEKIPREVRLLGLAEEIWTS